MKILKPQIELRAALPTAVLLIAFMVACGFCAAFGYVMRGAPRTSQHARFLAEHERTEVMVGDPFGCGDGVGRHFTAIMWGEPSVGTVCCGPEVQRRIGMECAVGGE